MRIMLCTLALNESEWIPKLYEQHKQWEGAEVVSWVFVEAADKVFAETNPDLVNKIGLSIDGTTNMLIDICGSDRRVRYLPHGFTSHEDKAQGKCQARNRYLEVADTVNPDYIVVVDADEFWPKDCQYELIQLLKRTKGKLGFSTNHKEIWHPPSVSKEPLFKYEVKGGFWDILYCRVWKYVKGMRYVRNHNTPVGTNGVSFERLMRNHQHIPADLQKELPYFVHMGFASNPENRRAKNEYYKARGEAVDDRRRWYTESRDCFNTWRPGDRLPRGAEVVPYTGIIPECFREDV